MYTLGGIKSPTDYRDVDLATAVELPAASSLPLAFEVDYSMLPVWDQHALGACVGHALGKDAQQKEFEENKKVVNFSPRFIYALAKCVDGYDGQGTYPRLAFKMWQKYGCATETTVPNDTTLDHETYCYQRKIENIPQVAFDDALKYRIKSYAFPTHDATTIKQTIYMFGGFDALLTIGSEWYVYKGDGAVPVPISNTIEGNHEVKVFGYKVVDGKTWLKYRNSWNNRWGLKGDGWLILEDYQPYFIEAGVAVDLPDDLLLSIHSLPAPGSFRYHFSLDCFPNVDGPSNDNDSTEVRALQIALNITGDSTDWIDPRFMGYFDSSLARSLKIFQGRCKIPQTGNLDAATRVQLNLIFNK